MIPGQTDRPTVGRKITLTLTIAQTLPVLIAANFIAVVCIFLQRNKKVIIWAEGGGVGGH
jgi:hypothetical protein